MSVEGHGHMEVNEATELRHKLLSAGYSPLPLAGKRPSLQGWQKKIDANHDEIDLWPKLFSYDTNTGILTKFTPAIDIDITNPEAAEAVETLAREKFEESGFLLTRIGKPPKRALLLRTDEPFEKLSRNFKSQDGSEHKIEILGDGQQLVVAGDHPETHSPYIWHGGQPWSVSREDLPYIRQSDALAFLDAAVALLIKDFNFVEIGKHREEIKQNGPIGTVVDIVDLLHQIHEGTSLHDSLRDLSASLMASGLEGHSAARLLRGLMGVSKAPRDDRWMARVAEIDRLVAGAKGFAKKKEPVSEGPIILSSAEFIAGFTPPDYLIDGILQKRFIYSLTGKTGAGKTAVLLLIASSVCLGKPIGHYGVERGRVLYLAGENPDDVRMRWIAMAQHLDFDPNEIDVWFVPGRFKISEIEAKARALGPFDLVAVDTSAAYYEGDDENNNVQIGTHARMLRSLIDLPGAPSVIVACHPTKNAADDNLQPRGGGAFIAEVDGNLTARQQDGSVEFHWQGKFRGPDFAPAAFQLETVTHERLRDTKGRHVPTVIARYLSGEAQENLAAAARNAEKQVLRAYADNPEASLAEIARNLGWSLKNGDPHKMKVRRAIEKLQSAKLVTVELGKPILTDKGKRHLNGGKNGYSADVTMND